ncbi:MAG: J domain-containing protein [Chloroflexi bacterium]|nr:MAG: J domain-containing protein [Chloroflexota bacterium]
MVERKRSTSHSSNLYEVLQVSPEANTEVIRAAYRTLARSQHPDVNPDPEATRHMRRLNAAYHILSDPARRARYDAARVRVAPVRPAARVARSTAPTVRPSAHVGARGHHRPRRHAADPVLLIDVPPSTARVGMIVLLAVAIAAAALVSLWALGLVLEDSSPYEIHLDAAAQPTLNRA